MRGSSRIALMVAVSPLALASCGGTRQDAHEPSGTFDVSIVKASFPAQQALAASSSMEITVRNEGTRTVPDVAVTVNSFAASVRPPDSVCHPNTPASAPPASPPSSCNLADPSRPVWIVNSGPQGADTAYTNTWALGPLAPQGQPGSTRTFVWNVTAVVPGIHTISWRVAAGLNGKARATCSPGAIGCSAEGIPEGTFQVNVANKTPQSRVDPNTGRVIRSAPAIAGGSRHSGGTSSSQGSSTP